jgi:hypothetical protein
MRYIGGVCVALCCVTGTAHADTKTYRAETIPEKSLVGCSGGGGTYTMDISNGVLTLGNSSAPKQFAEPIQSDGKITKSFKSPAGGNMEFIGLGNGAYELINRSTTCHYRLVP